MGRRPKKRRRMGLGRAPLHDDAPFWAKQPGSEDPPFPPAA